MSEGAQTELFRSTFAALAGQWPLKWQERLHREFCRSKVRTQVDLPTGLGKTSIITIWLSAIVTQARKGHVNLPRRLIYVVNRRTVVDQATNVVALMRKRLLSPDDQDWVQHAETLREIKSCLVGLGSGFDDLPIAVSTLRGELVDNEEWKTDPARPAVIVGTIDMIGSKLLFGGYGDGRYGRTHHAGLVGQDALIVHDEAHLTPAFGALLREIADTQKRDNEPRPVRVMELSATVRDSATDPFQLVEEDYEEQFVQQRLKAVKTLSLHSVQIDGTNDREDTLGISKAKEKRSKPSDILPRMIQLALTHRESAAKILIYVRTPKDARKLADILVKELDEDRVALLTGTLRGYERDQLVRENRVFRAMLDPKQSVDRTIFLVCTSAGEVGIDLDADHMVCDLSTLDSLIQRLGRVNRGGGKGRCARIDVVLPCKESAPSADTSAIEKSIARTRAILETWQQEAGDAGLSASPGSLRDCLSKLKPGEREAAYSPRPQVLALTDILLDAWALTSIREPMPGRPQVADYLHGLTVEPPETYVVWRAEVELLKQAGADEGILRDWFSHCRIESRERLRDRTDEVRELLKKLREPKKGELNDFNLVVLNERGSAQWKTLAQVADDAEFPLTYRTIVLPAIAGGLGKAGMLDAAAGEHPKLDVADEIGTRERWRVTCNADGAIREKHLLVGGTLNASESNKQLTEYLRISISTASEDMEGEGGTEFLVLKLPRRSARLNDPERAPTQQTLSEHHGLIAGHAKRLAQALRIDEEVRFPGLAPALVLAARSHDLGKNRPVWQRFARNPNADQPLAKSFSYLHSRALGGYRHEFGSLLEVCADEEIRKSPLSDLILHLIAAHHGWARPHFESRAWDNTFKTKDNEEATIAVMQRFGRLQQSFGRWGLAWIESLLRCADIAASQPQEQEGEPTSPKDGDA